MTGALGLIQLFLLSVILLTVVTSLVVALGVRLIRPRMNRVGPARRARLLTALCVAPLCVAVLQTALFFLPGVLGLIWPQMDHCLSHTASSHAHLCFVHPPGAAGAWLGWLIVLGSVIGLGRPLMRDLVRTWRSARLVRQLVRTAPRGHAEGVRVVDSDRPLAAATAVDSEVIVSTALVSALSPDLLDAVVAHERAHVRRRDPLRRMFAMLLSAGQLPGTRDRLLADLELACEQASDEAAAIEVGDRVRMAQALLAVARLLPAEPATPSPVTAGFGGSSVEARVGALLSPQLAEGRPVTEVAWLVVATAGSMAGAGPGHHLVEHAIALLGG